MSHSFIHSSTDGHLSCFHSLEVVNKAALNVQVLMFFWISVLGSFGYIPGSGIYFLPAPCVLHCSPTQLFCCSPEVLPCSYVSMTLIPFSASSSLFLMLRFKYFLPWICIFWVSHWSSYYLAVICSNPFPHLLQRWRTDGFRLDTHSICTSWQ